MEIFQKSHTVIYGNMVISIDGDNFHGGTFFLFAFYLLDNYIITHENEITKYYYQMFNI